MLLRQALVTKQTQKLRLLSQAQRQEHTQRQRQRQRQIQKQNHLNRRINALDAMVYNCMLLHKIQAMSHLQQLHLSMEINLYEDCLAGMPHLTCHLFCRMKTPTKQF